MGSAISGVYAIVNTVNKKIYIGQSVNIKSRWSTHRSRLNRNKHTNTLLQEEYSKYGKDSFSFLILEIVLDKNIIDKIETSWIKKASSLQQQYGYNIILENSIRLVGKDSSVARSVYQIDASYNVVKKWDCIAEAAREVGIGPSKISDCCKRKRLTAASFMWRYTSEPLDIEELKSKKRKFPVRKINQYSLDGELIKTWNHATHAQRETGTNRYLISQCCKGEMITSNDFIWRFGDKEYSKYELTKDLNRSAKCRVLQISKEFEIIKTWHSIKEILKEINVNRSTLLCARHDLTIINDCYWQNKDGFNMNDFIAKVRLKNMKTL